MTVEAGEEGTRFCWLAGKTRFEELRLGGGRDRDAVPKPRCSRLHRIEKTDSYKTGFDASSRRRAAIGVNARDEPRLTQAPTEKGG